MVDRPRPAFLRLSSETGFGGAAVPVRVGRHRSSRPRRTCDALPHEGRRGLGLRQGSRCDLELGVGSPRCGRHHPNRIRGLAGPSGRRRGAASYLGPRATRLGAGDPAPRRLPPPGIAVPRQFLHPQDLLALGIVLGALACVRTDRWAWAGVLVALALLSQQFALLVGVPLLVIAPATRRWAYVRGAAGTMTLAVVALFASAGSGAVKSALVGSGDSGGWGGTWLFALHPDVHVLGFVSRVVPLELSLVVAWWLANRLGAAVLEPVPLVSLVTLSLSLRLVFEANLIGYYFMALAVMLVLLDAVCGHFRASVVAWLIGVSVTFLVGPSTSFLAWPVNWASSKHLVRAHGPGAGHSGAGIPRRTERTSADRSRLGGVGSGSRAGVPRLGERARGVGVVAGCPRRSWHRDRRWPLEGCAHLQPGGSSVSNSARDEAPVIFNGVTVPPGPSRFDMEEHPGPLI